MTSAPERVRERIALRRWAERMVDREYEHPGDRFTYTEEQAARNARKRRDRVRWLMLRGPYRPPTSKALKESRIKYLRATTRS